MLVYLDVCCLKRPFDDQSQARIRLESEAVLSLLAAESETLRVIRSAALFLENAQNPIAVRAARVDRWLQAGPIVTTDPAELKRRTAELIARGIGNFDALHIATAEFVKADMFGTCDDRLVKAAAKMRGFVRVRVMGVVELAAEVLT